jgi:cysteine desulfurase
LLHTDAIQAANYCDTNVLRLGVDMMTLSGSKIYGPKSSGMLFIKNKDWLNPILFGGGQEFGLRSGTEDVAQVIGFAKALEIAQHKKDQEVTRLTVLRDFLIHQLLADDRIRLNGSMIDRLPNNINITVSGYSAESLVIQLAAHGFSVASKSACQSDNDEESHVIAALRAAKFAKKSLPNQSTNTEEGSLRITLGRGTTKSQIVRFHRVLRKILDNIY